MAQKKTNKRRTKVKNLDVKSEKLGAKELKKVKGGAKQLDATTQSGGPTAAQNQKIQELTFN
jgi:hypothetical protein